MEIAARPAGGLESGRPASRTSCYVAIHHLRLMEIKGIHRIVMDILQAISMDSVGLVVLNGMVWERLAQNTNAKRGPKGSPECPQKWNQKGSQHGPQRGPKIGPEGIPKGCPK